MDGQTEMDELREQSRKEIVELRQRVQESMELRQIEQESMEQYKERLETLQKSYKDLQTEFDATSDYYETRFATLEGEKGAAIAELEKHKADALESEDKNAELQKEKIQRDKDIEWLHKEYTEAKEEIRILKERQEQIEQRILIERQEQIEQKEHIRNENDVAKYRDRAAERYKTQMQAELYKNESDAKSRDVKACPLTNKAVLDATRAADFQLPRSASVEQPHRSLSRNRQQGARSKHAVEVFMPAPQPAPGTSGKKKRAPSAGPLKVEKKRAPSASSIRKSSVPPRTRTPNNIEFDWRAAAGMGEYFNYGQNGSQHSSGLASNDEVRRRRAFR